MGSGIYNPVMWAADRTVAGIYFNMTNNFCGLRPHRCTAGCSIFARYIAVPLRPVLRMFLHRLPIRNSFLCRLCLSGSNFLERNLLLGIFSTDCHSFFIPLCIIGIQTFHRSFLCKSLKNKIQFTFCKCSHVFFCFSGIFLQNIDDVLVWYIEILRYFMHAVFYHHIRTFLLICPHRASRVFGQIRHLPRKRRQPAFPTQHPFHPRCASA